MLHAKDININALYTDYLARGEKMEKKKQRTKDK